MKKTSFNIAFGGMISALCVVLEFGVGIAPMFLYIFPMICGLLMTVLLEECGMKISLCVYLGVSVISLLIAPDKEAALMYTAFFGYYPIARELIMRLRARPVCIIAKLALFNAAMICSYSILIRIIGLEAAGLDGGSWVIITLLVVGNITFFAFDIALERLLLLYRTKFRGRLFGGRRKK